ncbi:MAG: hypothetical protein RLZ32_696 [Gemmatimonadota bacterium]|jgi:hypothetical protein
MTNRHLRPDEFDLLLDHEEGFGVAPLRQHVEGCPTCRAELSAQQAVVAALDTLPDLAPSAGFANRVMAEVPVFEPWHAALSRSVTPLVPATRWAQLAAGMAAAVGLGGVTAGATWVLARADMAVLLAQFGVDRLRGELQAGGASLVSAALGQGGEAALRGASPEEIALWVGGGVAVAGMAVVGLRSLVSAPSRR